MELYDPAQDVWLSGPALPPISGGGTLSFAGAARARVGLCVVGGAAHSAASSVHMLVGASGRQPGRGRLPERQHSPTYDLIEDTTWRRCPLPNVPRVHAAMATLSGDVFLLVTGHSFLLYGILLP